VKSYLRQLDRAAVAFWSVMLRRFMSVVTPGSLMRGFDGSQGSMRGIGNREHAKQGHQKYRNNSTHLLPFPVVPKD